MGLIGVCQDLSAIKQMEERMRQADRLATVGRLSANIAHEIRNPLASVSGAIEALARELPPDPTQSRLVEIVLHESERLNRLITDFLDYARPAPLTMVEVDVARMVEEVLLLLEHRRAPDGLKVVKVVNEVAGPLPIRADPQLVRQVLWNLCLNAVQAMPDGGELRVGGRRHGVGWIRVWVADTGSGIAEEDLPHVFEPFYSTKPEGTGLGLALGLPNRAGPRRADRGAEPRGRRHGDDGHVARGSRAGEHHLGSPPRNGAGTRPGEHPPEAAGRRRDRARRRRWLRAAACLG